MRLLDAFVETLHVSILQLQELRGEADSTRDAVGFSAVCFLCLGEKKSKGQRAEL